MTVLEWNYPCSCFWVSLALDGIGGDHSDTWAMSIILRIIMRIMMGMMKYWIMGVVMMMLRRIRT